jgi:hypothetical protein
LYFQLLSFEDVIYIFFCFSLFALVSFAEMYQIKRLSKEEKREKDFFFPLKAILKGMEEIQ